jgi:formylglycine-generating enzyme required for sulfatase activity
MKKIVIFAIILIIFSLSFAGNDSNKTKNPSNMVLIPAGSFQMGINKSDLKELIKMGHDVPHMNELNAYWWFGNELPAHMVKVKAFYMDAYEVTNREFMEFVKETGYKAQGNWQKYATKDRMDHPVVNVTWNDAEAYAKWVGKRLPTEEEWEYAATGGKNVKWFPWGNSPDPTKANYRSQGESFFAGLIRILGFLKINTKPVGSYEANGFGLYDMCGNVSEWCENIRKPYPGGPTDTWIYSKFGPYKDNQKPKYGRAIRGGSWITCNSVFLTIKYRRGEHENYFSNYLGFRCVKSIKERK